jgi:predicted transposase YbfD/YdcC
LIEITAAPTQTMMKTISNKRVLSYALVAEERITASIRQKRKGPQRSPKSDINNKDEVQF